MSMEINKIYTGDSKEVLKTLPDKSVNCIVTSPPYYGLRDYGMDGQMGLEETPQQYIDSMVELFRECKRVLRDDGTLWVNIGDSYAANRGYQVPGNISGKETNIAQSVNGRGMKAADYGVKPKDLIGIPWMLAFALRADGWYLRKDNIWHKPNPMPESVTDRTTTAHEYIFHFSKSAKYYYDAEAIKTPMECSEYDKRSRQGRKRFPTALVNGIRGNNPDKIYEMANKRSVWTVNTKPYTEAHFATFPEELITDCIKSGCPENGIVLDPFSGAGTTALVAAKLNRKYIGIELNPQYVAIAEKRLRKELGMFYQTTTP